MFSPRATELFLQNRLNKLEPGPLSKCTNLQDLNIAQNWLPILPDDIGSCKKLQYLYANVNRFTQLPASFTNLTNLRRLELQTNWLTTLGNQVWDMMSVRRCCLSGLTQLRHLKLHENLLTKLPDCLFDDLHELETLTLYTNQLESLPDNIGNLGKLTGGLDLSKNCLTTLPPSFFNLRQLSELNAANNKLVSLPDALSQATHLKRLILNNNCLQALPSLKILQLEILDLAHNQLQFVPHGMCHTFMTPTPILSHNCITQLPDDFSNTRASTIKLDHNLLTALPNMPETEFRLLDVSHNWLEQLPEQFPYGITQVSVHHNCLTTIPEAAKIVTDWDLSDNKIADPGLLLPWPTLTDIILQNNGICKLPDNMGDFQALQEINLDNNQLTTLPDDIGRLTQLRRLWLRSNQLTYLPSTMSSCSALTALVLSNNPNLSELPLSFSSIGNLVELICDNTGIARDVRQTILNSTRELRDATSAARAASQLRMWAATARTISSPTPDRPISTNLMTDSTITERVNDLQSPFGLMKSGMPNTGMLTTQQQQLLSEWMHRLENTKDFRRNQAELASVVMRILETVVVSSVFADQFFAQVSVNMGGCGDRASMSLNELFTAWVLHTLSNSQSHPDRVGQINDRVGQGQTDSDSQTSTLLVREDDETRLQNLSLCIGVAKTNTLRQLVASMHLTTESVETYLYVESKLREELGLVTACRCMLYGASAPVDLALLSSQVEATYHVNLFTFLEQNPHLFPNFPLELSQSARELFDASLDTIEYNFALSGGQEQEYMDALNSLKVQRERALLIERQTWLQENQFPKKEK